MLNWLIVEVEKTDWNYGLGHKVNELIKALPKELRSFDWNRKVWKVKHSDQFVKELQDLQNEFKFDPKTRVDMMEFDLDRWFWEIFKVRKQVTRIA